MPSQNNKFINFTSWRFIWIVGDFDNSEVKLLKFSSGDNLVNLNPLKFDLLSKELVY